VLVQPEMEKPVQGDAVGAHAKARKVRRAGSSAPPLNRTGLGNALNLMMFVKWQAGDNPQKLRPGALQYRKRRTAVQYTVPETCQRFAA
jgi:hypothetical protein